MKSNVYSSKKIFYFKEKLDSLYSEISEILPPVHVRLKPTNICNHNCYYCAYKSDNLQLGKDMDQRDFIPRDKIIEIIDDFIDMGVKAVTFSGGGEPLTYPYIVDALKRLIAGGIKFACLTNGSKLEGEAAELFAAHATWVRVSMDGYDGESYAKYRNVSDREFGKVIANIKNFIALKGPASLGVSFIIGRDNAGHVKDFLRLMRDIGVASVKVSAAIVGNSVSENNDYHKPVFQMVKEQIAEAKRELLSDNFEIYDTYHMLDELFDKPYKWCPMLQIRPVIGADLNVYSCQDKAYNLDEGLLGSIRDKSFKEFWFDGKEKFFKINPSVLCRHHCVSNKLNSDIIEFLSVDKRHLEFV